MTAFDYVCAEFFNEKAKIKLDDIRISARELANEIEDAQKMYNEDKSILQRAEKQLTYIADMFFKKADKSRVIRRLSMFCIYGALWKEVKNDDN